MFVYQTVTTVLYYFNFRNWNLNLDQIWNISGKCPEFGLQVNWGICKYACNAKYGQVVCAIQATQFCFPRRKNCNNPSITAQCKYRVHDVKLTEYPGHTKVKARKNRKTQVDVEKAV